MVLMIRVSLKASWHFYLWCPLPFPVVLCVWLKQKHSIIKWSLLVPTLLTSYVWLDSLFLQTWLLIQSLCARKWRLISTPFLYLPIEAFGETCSNSETHPIYLAENIACEVLSTFQVKLTFVSFKHEYYVTHIVIFLRHNACWNIIPQQRE